MSLFPTQLAMNIAKAAGIDKLTTHPTVDLNAAMADFQRISVVGDFEDALILIKAHFTRGELSEEQIDALEKIYDFTSIEVDGIMIDRVGIIARDSQSDSVSLSAVQVMNAIKNGEDDVTKGAVKKVIFELEKTGE